MSDFTAELKPANPQGPDILQAERAKSAINVEQLANHLFNRDDFLGRQKKMINIMEKHPYFSKKNQLNLARPDRYHLALARAKELRRMAVEFGLDDADYSIADYLADEPSPFVLHKLMFETSLKEQCNDEQRSYWLPKATNWEIIGCYGQTELGHGSNVRGVECEARWNPDTKDFSIHSPTLTAAKWWNGALGRTANHAIVVAQLMLPDESARKLISYGPHQFIVQIRDLKTNKPLDGIVIGDIGPKFGYTSMDNGYMLFKDFRVPHSALLARHSGVDQATGAYIPPKKRELVYGSMTFVRAQLIMHARLVLAKAVTIAVRYTSIRRQFADRDASRKNAPEVTVLDYPTVQYRILPLLATTYALHYTGEAMYNLYWSTRAEIENQGDASGLAEMHAASSGLKSICTILAADGIEVCRRAMGGHGFSGSSGFMPLNTDYYSKPTVEGDNWMITQQTASYLIKRMTLVAKKSPDGSRNTVDSHFKQFLRTRPDSHNFKVYSSDMDIVRAFRHRASACSYQAYVTRVERRKPWTSMMIQLHRLAIAYAESLLVSNFYNAILETPPKPTVDGTSHGALRTCFRLFSFVTMERQAAEFILTGALKPAQLQDLTPAIELNMSELRPHAVRLVDAWSIPDYLLNSALGRYDGDVYNDLFQRAHKQNPLNLQTFNSDWKTHEIIKGEGEDAARKRIEALALGVEGHEQAGAVKASL